MAVSVVASNLATLSIVGLLYGIFFCLFCVSTYMLIRRSGVAGRRFYETMPFIGGTLLFCTVTPHYIIIVFRSFMAFVNYESGTMPLVYYSILDDASNLASTAFTILTILIADALMIYRLWALWDHNIYVITLPVLLSIADVVCGIAEMYVETHYSITDPDFLSRIHPWITSSCVQTLSTNIYCCALISWRLWRKSQHHKTAGIDIRGVAVILVESAGLYVAWTIAWFGVYESGSAVEEVLAEALIPVTGIAFMLINVRVGLEHITSSRAALSSDSSRWQSALPRTPRDTEHATAVPVPFIVDVTRTVDTTFDESSMKFAPPESVELSAVHAV